MLSKRLKMVYDLIPDNKIVADIGTDHAYLACQLALTEKSTKIYACDNKNGPLEQAKKNSRQYGVDDKVICILSDGLTNIPNDAQVVVIAGMGFESATMILEAAKSRLDKLDSIIVQVNKNVVDFRKWVAKQKYTIINESIVFDDFYYQAVQFHTTSSSDYTIEDIYLGPHLKQEKSAVFIDFLTMELNKINLILAYRSTEDLKLKKKIIENYLL